MAQHSMLYVHKVQLWEPREQDQKIDLKTTPLFGEDSDLTFMEYLYNNLLDHKKDTFTMKNYSLGVDICDNNKSSKGIMTKIEGILHSGKKGELREKYNQSQNMREIVIERDEEGVFEFLETPLYFMFFIPQGVKEELYIVLETRGRFGCTIVVDRFIDSLVDEYTFNRDPFYIQEKDMEELIDESKEIYLNNFDDKRSDAVQTDNSLSSKAVKVNLEITDIEEIGKEDICSDITNGNVEEAKAKLEDNGRIVNLRDSKLRLRRKLSIGFDSDKDDVHGSIEEKESGRPNWNQLSGHAHKILEELDLKLDIPQPSRNSEISDDEKIIDLEYELNSDSRNSES